VVLAAGLAWCLSAGWWRAFFARLRSGEVHPGYPVLPVIAAFGAAYALEWAFLAWQAGWVVELPGVGGRVLPGLSMERWLLGHLHLAPYALAAAGVLLLSRPERPGLRVGLDAGAWRAVAPAFRTLVPWSAVVLLVWIFPHSSSALAGLGSRLGSLAYFGANVLLRGLLTMPFFLGVVMPTLGRLLGVRAAVPEGEGAPAAGASAAGRALAVICGAAVMWVWAVLLPRPGGLAGAFDLSPLHALASAVSYLVAAFVQEADRTLVWAPLAAASVWLLVGLVPSLVAVFLRW
jgi:hypothetical protein